MPPAPRRTVKVTLHPPPDVGLHGWIYGRVHYLKKLGAAPEDVFAKLREVLDTYPLRRPVPDRELQAAVDDAFSKEGPAREAAPVHFNNGWPSEIPVPRGQPDPALIERIPSVSLPDAAGSIDDLFTPDTLLCVGRTAAKFEALPASEVFPADFQFIVPNPLRFAQGRTRHGRLSCHCRDAVGPRKYIIVESDAGLSKERQIDILWWLKTETEADLRAIVDSRGKSIHGWFQVDDVPPETLFAWFKIAIRVGADPRLWLPEQFVRMPGGTRDNGETQEVVWCAPASTLQRSFSDPALVEKTTPNFQQALST